MRSIINRLKYGTLKAGQLKELEQEEQTNKLSRFQERNIKGCYKVMTKYYFIKDKLKTLKKYTKNSINSDLVISGKTLMHN